MKKKVMVTAVALTMLVGGYLSFTTADGETGKAVAGKPTYDATFYVAGMGGHFSVADVTIDPNNTEQPIILNGNPGMVTPACSISAVNPIPPMMPGSTPMTATSCSGPLIVPMKTAMSMLVNPISAPARF